MFVFDADTQIEQVGDFRYRCELGAHYNIGKVPNGGYQMSVVTKAVAAAVEHARPLVITGYFMNRTHAGPVFIDVEPLNSSRTTSTAMARLIQDDVETARFLTTFIDLASGNDALDHVEGAPPIDFGRTDLMRLPTIDGVTPVILEQFHMDMDPALARAFMGQPGDTATIQGLLRFADGREPDIWCLPLVADAWPPAWFMLRGPTSWVPTLEMTVQMRAEPAPGPLSCKFTSRFATRGYLEEDGEVWDSEGRLVALSRQTARVLR